MSRFATLADIDRVVNLAIHSFPVTGYTPDEWREMLLEPDHGGLGSLLVATDRDDVVAACRLLPYQQYIGGRALPTMGLSTVAVSPTARRRGIAARLVIDALRAARERGDACSLLYPFRTAFYRKLGYGMAGEAKQYIFPPRWLPDDPARDRVEITTSPDQRAELQSLYDRWISTTNGQLVRTAFAWRRVWQQGTRHGALYRGEDGTPTGYLIFRYLNEGPGKSTVDVEEAVMLDPEARRALYGWLASLGDQWDAIVYRAHPDEHFAEYLSELRNPAAQYGPRWNFWFSSGITLIAPMFRIVDMERALSARALNEGRATTIALRLHDPHIQENSRTWTLKMANLQATLSDERTISADLTIETDVETLSRIFIGALSIRVAMQVGRATVDRPNLLGNIDRMLALPSPWTFDRF